ncbi:MAG: DHH family phosphoesterase [Lachnospiraceae bacterium]|nr:DHH family phosphoesterase [Lachnospiraceae bacterium]
MKHNKAKGDLRTYGNWPLILSVLLLVPVVAIYFISPMACLVMGIVWLLYLAASLWIFFYSRKGIRRDLVSYATQFGQVQKGLLKGLAIPYALLDENGRFIWSNTGFSSVIHKGRIYSKSITTYFPEIGADSLPPDEKTVSVDISYNNRDYRVDMRRISLDEGKEGELEAFKGEVIALFLFDVTDVNMYMRLNREQSLVSGLMYLDNYDETLESVEDVRRSLLAALIDRKINKYFHDMDAVVKKLEKDKYFIVMKRISFDRMRDGRFDILEDVKNVNIGNQMSVTLSIGFGMGTDSFLQDSEYARNAIDLALGRGGDQAVVKTPDKIIYFGGKSQQVEKSTRVKARVKANALREIIESKDQILVMGHKVTDIDSLGASVGVYRASDALHKKCHIVMNEAPAAIRPFVEAFRNSKDYAADFFVTSSEAVQLCDENTAVVVVDTNRPNMTECPDLLEIAKTIVVLDHHRMGTDRIPNVTLSYIESYASSACEMISEILQYITDNIRIKGIEADSLYAGIMIDTNNFMTKAGVRTFEAAAFLRRSGADVTRVRKLFRNDIADYKARAEAVRNAELYKGKYAISVCPNNVESPTVVGAQAANELLNINLVKASFILTDYQDVIYVSARSIDEVNVQVVMERIGGGGHLNIAGAQLSGKSLEEAREILKTTLDEMEAEGELK